MGTIQRMTPQEFIARWPRGTSFREKQDAQTWFLDLLRVVGHPDPNEYGDREKFTFEKPIPGGFADAFHEGHFVWEFKGEEAKLAGAFQQCLRYSVHLKTPPLLIVSSFQLIRIQTNFRGKETHLHEIAFEDLYKPEPLAKLRNIFFHPEEFEPQRTVEELTEETAENIGEIVAAMDLDDRNEDSERLARYLNQVIFCLYAEDADDLLPSDSFTDIVNTHYKDPNSFNQVVNDLFAKMADGGYFGASKIPHFNGDLFNHSDTVELSGTALFHLQQTVWKNWREIDPSIFGTLFERALDASKRAQLGAHYTAAADILCVIEPVLLKPLRREWQAIRQAAESSLSREKRDDASARLAAFRHRLATLRVLDPACGSGNFLYLAMSSLLDIELEVIEFAAGHGWHNLQPTIKPNQFLGIELDTYAAELARTALWIGYIQWHQANGFPYTHSPLLTTLDTIQQRDAILTTDAAGQPSEPEWPAAEFIIGNPPFLGRGYLRNELGDEYTNDLYTVYSGRLPNASDLCCYWFEKARHMIEIGKSRRCGLLGTQGIRGRDNRVVLDRIKKSGNIFLAYRSLEWKLSGAAVNISIIGFDDGSEQERLHNGVSVSVEINSNLSIGVDTAAAKPLIENRNLSFEGQSPKARFDISEELAAEILAQPLNVNGRPNSDVVLPVMNASDITKKHRGMYTINFGLMGLEESSQYEMPFEYVKKHVWPTRQKKSQKQFRNRWWQYATPRPVMRAALANLQRFIATPRVSKYRVFIWVNPPTVCTDAVDVFALDDDYSFGVLQSKYHRIWASDMGTQLRSTPRYTPTTCFETFPFPRPNDEQRQAIAAAAKSLNELRETWLNPFDELGRPYLEGSAELKRRTLTNLYNQNPTWLQNAHANLDAAVAVAYGWPPDLPEEEILARLLALNLKRAAS